MADINLGGDYEIDEDSNGDLIIRHTPSGDTIQYDSANNGFVGDNFNSIGTEGTSSTKVNNSVTTETLRETSNYLQEPKPVRVSPDTILVVYREGDVHGVDSAGKLVAQRSTDLGDSWESPITVVDGNGDDRNPSIVHDEGSGRVTVFYRAYDSNDNLQGIYYVSSTDEGQSWSSRTQLTATQNSVIAPFGDYVKTSNGLMTTILTDNSGTRTVEAVFSTDGGQTWGSASTVIDETDTGYDISEPCPFAATDDKVMCLVRDDRRSGLVGGYAIVQSTDGGASWNNQIFEVNPLDNEFASNLYLKRAMGNQIIGMSGTRANAGSDTLPMKVLRIPASAVWDDPTRLDSDAEITTVKDPLTSETQDWGYSQFVSLDPSANKILMFWMDDEQDNGSPDIWQGSFAPSGDNSRFSVFNDDRESRLFEAAADDGNFVGQTSNFTTGVGSSATLIADPDAGMSDSIIGMFVLVQGDDQGSSARFTDLVLLTRNGGVTTVASSGVNSPATRSYTEQNSAELSLAMGSGTYDVVATSSVTRMLN